MALAACLAPPSADPAARADEALTEGPEWARCWSEPREASTAGYFTVKCSRPATSTSAFKLAQVDVTATDFAGRKTAGILDPAGATTRIGDFAAGQFPVALRIVFRPSAKPEENLGITRALIGGLGLANGTYVPASAPMVFRQPFATWDLRVADGILSVEPYSVSLRPMRDETTADAVTVAPPRFVDATTLLAPQNGVLQVRYSIGAESRTTLVKGPGTYRITAEGLTLDAADGGTPADGGSPVAPSCGAPGLACCPGNACAGGLCTIFGRCISCGHERETCCRNRGCDEGLTCSSTNQCGRF